MNQIIRPNTVMATTCQHTGSECPALARMAEKLAEAMQAARPITADDFEIEGHSILKHCPQQCPAYFRANHDCIRIFAGVDKEADTAHLNQMADALFSPTNSCGFPVSEQRGPCAMVEIKPQSIPQQGLGSHQNAQIHFT